MRPEIEQAVALLQRGDDEALEQALALLQNTVFSFSMRVCGQREDAEDTMQDVLVKSIPHLPRFDSPKALLVWLYKVAKNRCLMSRRRSKFAPRQEFSLGELMPDRSELERLSAGSINPEAFAIRSEEAGRLRAAIQRLPPPYRIVLVLRDMEGLTDDEVAEITGLRPGTVRVRLHRARLFVRKELMKAWKPSPSNTGLGKTGATKTGPGKTGPEKSGPEKTGPTKTGEVVASRTVPTAQRRPAPCKAMFAELSDYLDEQLDDSLCDELEKHLDGCAPCKAFLASLEATIDQCRTAPEERPDRKKAGELLRKLLTDYEQIVAGNFP